MIKSKGTPCISTVESQCTRKQGKISLYSSSLFCPPCGDVSPLPFPAFPIQLLSLSLIIQFRSTILRFPPLPPLYSPFIFSHLYSRSVAAPTHRLLYSFNPLFLPFQHQPLCDVSFWLRRVSRGWEGVRGEGWIHKGCKEIWNFVGTLIIGISNLGLFDASWLNLVMKFLIEIQIVSFKSFLFPRNYVNYYFFLTLTTRFVD